MQIEKSKVEKLKITEVKNLDLINVFIEDLGPGQGKITFECYGRSWSAYWGAMGNRTMGQFFCCADTEYLIEKLDGELRETIYEDHEDETGTPNPKYKYLCRIIDTVKKALSESNPQ